MQRLLTSWHFLQIRKDGFAQLAQASFAEFIHTWAAGGEGDLLFLVRRTRHRGSARQEESLQRAARHQGDTCEAP